MNGDTDRIVRAIEASRDDIEAELGVFAIEVDDERVWVVDLNDRRWGATMTSRHADARLTLTDPNDAPA